MSSISLSLKMLLAGSAFAGLTLLACGEDGGGGGGDTPTGTIKTDGGAKKDGGAGGKKDAAVATPMYATGAVEGEECTGLGGMCDDDQCDEAPCVATCTDSVYDACKSGKDLISLYGGDAGGLKLPTVDSGLGRDKDGGFTFTINDATVPLPTAKCPDPFFCNSALKDVGAPDQCASKGGGPFGLDGPPACSDNSECAAMGLNVAVCQELPGLGKVCFAPCTP